MCIRDRVQSLQLEAGFRHQGALHSPRSSHEENPAVRFSLPEQVGYCNGRIDVATGPAAGKHHIQMAFPLTPGAGAPAGNTEHDAHFAQVHHQIGAAVGEEGQAHTCRRQKVAHNPHKMCIRDSPRSVRSVCTNAKISA